MKEEKDKLLKSMEQGLEALQAQSQALEDSQSQALQAHKDQALQAQTQATEQTLQALEGQKAQALEAHQKEQAAAWTDYEKQTARHGPGEEALAAEGLRGSGYAESSRVAYYTAYQNRVAGAKEGLRQATLAYDQAMAQARSQGNAALAQIALEALEQQLQLELEAFRRREALESQAREGRWKLLELARQEAQDQEDRRRFELEYALKLEELQPQPSGGSTGSGSSGKKTETSLAQPMDEAQIRQLQRYLGVPATGRWDATTQAGAKSRGLGDARSVLEAMELADGDHVLDTYPKLSNPHDDTGFYIGQRYYTYREAEDLLARGELEKTVAGDGTYRYRLPLKPKAPSPIQDMTTKI